MTDELEYYWSLGEHQGNGTKPCVIYKVQQHIRMVDKLCYEPCILSIGPYHHGTPALRTMQKEKWSYLDYILKLNCDRSLLDYLHALEGLAKLARNCYSEEIEMDGEEFLQMLLLDGCFILVALGGTKEILAHAEQDSLEPEGALAEIEQENRPHTEGANEVQSADEQTISQEGNQDGKRTEYDNEIGQWFARFFNHDLFLLENQIPFFIVKKIYEVVSGDSRADASFTREIEKYVESSLWWFPKSVQGSSRPKDFHHLLHLCHMYFRPNQKAYEINHLAGPQYFHRFLSIGRKYLKIGLYSDETEECSSLNPQIPYLQDGQHLNRWRRAAQYLEAGVKFKKHLPYKLHPHSLLDIKFSDGVVEIPFIVIDEHTGTLFRNLIAFEQTCPQFGDDFTAYSVFLSQLISMPEDVTLLAQRDNCASS
ncbi:hypothetical protein C2845_PM15G23350 [Panicum miliaceum]|uniref:Uncharacterized protein n=1 Tax=Panicum miliaceum TaxID=4540 RepID=A0A3L6Q8F7_PANMI|nr:hypothetical protein C2845_PM15G23350 [Panicum miliaceum]